MYSITSKDIKEFIHHRNGYAWAAAGGEDPHFHATVTLKNTHKYSRATDNRH